MLLGVEKDQKSLTIPIIIISLLSELLSVLILLLRFRTSHLSEMHMIHSVGSMLEPRYIFGASRRRIVSCYTLFKGWLPLSQPPICLWRNTSFNT